MKKTLQAVLAGAALTGSTILGGYYGAGERLRDERIAEQQTEKENLEAMLRSTYSIEVNTVYTMEFTKEDGTKETKDIENTFTGSAVALHNDDKGTYFLTSHHVIEAPNEKTIPFPIMPPFVYVPVVAKLKSVTYFLNTGAGNEPLELLATSEPALPEDFEEGLHLSDLALVRTTKKHYTWEGPLALRMKTGDTLYSTGFIGDEWKNHIINGMVRSTTDTSHPDSITPTTLPINAGNSGGGVFREVHTPEGKRYELAGINRGTYRYKDLSVVVSPQHIKKFLESAGLGKLYRR